MIPETRPPRTFRHFSFTAATDRRSRRRYKKPAPTLQVSGWCLHGRCVSSGPCDTAACQCPCHTPNTPCPGQ